MNSREAFLIDKLIKNHSLELEEYAELIDLRSEEGKERLKEEAVRIRQSIYGNDVYIRGIVEFSNHCKNNCIYCGIRAGNQKVERYRLTKEEILGCCEQGYQSGIRTFVLQSGEDGHYSDEVMCDIVSAIHEKYPDCAITLSIGERSRESYEKLYQAGADRYLLRHETADKAHYEKLHPENMSWDNRMNCLKELREIGYQVGAGMMLGSPYQDSMCLAKDLKFIETFKPDMCGIGPFIPHRDTPFHDREAGTLEMTLFFLSVIRIIHPSILLPATTALGTIDPRGREKGIEAGANVIMPNLSPTSVRKNYELYDDKICMGDDPDHCRGCLERRVKSINYRIVTARGDIKDAARIVLSDAVTEAYMEME